MAEPFYRSTSHDTGHLLTSQMMVNASHSFWDTNGYSCSRIISLSTDTRNGRDVKNEISACVGGEHSRLIASVILDPFSTSNNSAQEKRFMIRVYTEKVNKITINARNNEAYIAPEANMKE